MRVGVKTESGVDFPDEIHMLTPPPIAPGKQVRWKRSMELELDFIC